MAKVESQASRPHSRRKALTPEAREEQLIGLAVDIAEQRLRNGTATAQEIVHFLKLGSTRSKREDELMDEQIKMVKAKTQAIESSQRVEELYNQALDAMRRYSGNLNQSTEEDIY